MYIPILCELGITIRYMNKYILIISIYATEAERHILCRYNIYLLLPIFLYTNVTITIVGIPKLLTFFQNPNLILMNK